MTATPTLSFDRVLDSLKGDLPVSKTVLQKQILRHERELARLRVQNRTLIEERRDLIEEIEKRDRALLATVGPMSACWDGSECEAEPVVVH